MLNIHRVEKTSRRYCENRLVGGVSTSSVVNEIMNRRCGGHASSQSDCQFGSKFHDELAATAEKIIFPTMNVLGTETTTDKVTHHGYHRFYERHFTEFRDQRNLRIFEIGLARGSSTNLWCGYFKTAVIVGVDITLHPGETQG